MTLKDTLLKPLKIKSVTLYHKRAFLLLSFRSINL
uniref:Uncharacterized protein n=1 Tax=Ackermannviridae sp. ctaCq7 TaxID=2827294 RepID=A0A8S5R5B0_9CAUD|nr:MAG TPA: hypothetical protein [Ackermannviridae sp. ctaCq7]